MNQALEQRLAALPHPAAKPVSIRVDHSASASIRRGNPWVFASGITRAATDGQPGDTAIVYDHRNKLAGVGFLDPDSPIRVRLLNNGPLQLNEDAITKRIAAAFDRRTSLSTDPSTTGWRLLHGPNDGLPGLVADTYADTVVIKLYSAVWLPHLRTALRAIHAAHPWTRLVLRLARGPAPAYAACGLHDGDILDGPPLNGAVPFQENGIWFEAEPIVGQKTGFFLDQRENRERVERLSHRARVLNVFSYTGGFSLYAARGGATHVVSVDLSKPATAACERNFALNHQDSTIRSADHRAVAGDAFKVMSDMVEHGQQFDVVIIDPPAFAKKAAEVERALAAYARLTRLGLDTLAPGGTLVLASCSSRIQLADFEKNATHAAALHGWRLNVVERSTQPLDHPAAFDEAGYLKCLFTKPDHASGSRS